jgi:hypothetical protein
VAEPDRAFWACSGAKTTDLKEPGGLGNGQNGNWDQPNQEKTVGPNTQYVSLSVGGDDAEFGAIGDACTSILIGKHQFKYESKESCSAQLLMSDKIVSSLPKKLTAIYSTILNRASPTAVLAVLNYPEVLPPNLALVPIIDGQQWCVLDKASIGPEFAGIAISATDAQLIGTFEAKLNAAISQAVTAAANAHGGRVKLVDDFDNSVPRDCLGDRQPNATVAGVSLSFPKDLARNVGHIVTYLKEHFSGTFHPTTAGQLLLAIDLQSAFGS